MGSNLAPTLDRLASLGLKVCLADLPGPVSRDAGEIASAIVGGTTDRGQLDRFRERFVHPADGGAARRIVELALGARPAELV